MSLFSGAYNGMYAISVLLEAVEKHKTFLIGSRYQTKTLLSMLKAKIVLKCLIKTCFLLKYPEIVFDTDTNMR